VSSRDGRAWAGAVRRVADTLRGVGGGNPTAIAIAGIAATAAVGIAVPVITAWFAHRREDTHELCRLLDDAILLLMRTAKQHVLLVQRAEEAVNEDDPPTRFQALRDVNEMLEVHFSRRMDLVAMGDQLTMRIPEAHPILVAFTKAEAAFSSGAGELGSIGTPDRASDLESRLKRGRQEIDEARLEFTNAARDLVRSRLVR
jgi:hypothetical protein